MMDVFRLRDRVISEYRSYSEGFKLVNAMSSLKFLVLDELHTYRGRQGADVAMLVRRVREACGSTGLQCVGTSATLSTEGTPSERSIQVAEVASKLFGTEVRPSEVIAETLRRTTPEASDWPEFSQELKHSVAGDTPESTDYDALCRDPLSSWIESTFGIRSDDEGRLVRAKPIPIEGSAGGAEQLSTTTGLSRDTCENAIRRRLLAGTAVRNSENGNPVFAFRLHQFLSAGGAVHRIHHNRSISICADRRRTTVARCRTAVARSRTTDDSCG